MSILAKLQILLLLTGVGVTVYMIFLYKEVRNVEKDLENVKKQLLNLQHASSVSLNNTSEVVDVAPIAQKPVAQKTQKETIEEHIAVNDHAETDSEWIPVPNEDDCDNDSVTSNEIKDILTNIHEDDNNNAETEDSCILKSIPKDMVEEEKDLTLLEEQDLQSMKYDDIRNFLRRKGFSNKGTKQDYIQKILDMKKVEDKSQ